MCAHFAATIGLNPLLFYVAFTSFWMIKIYFHDFKPTICRCCHCCWLWLGIQESLMNSYLPGEKIHARLDFCCHSSSPLCGQVPTMSYKSQGQWWLLPETPDPFSWVYKNAHEYLWVFFNYTLYLFITHTRIVSLSKKKWKWGTKHCISLVCSSFGEAKW